MSLSGTSSRPASAEKISSHMPRSALLAGVAIVERAGPEMLRMLQGHTFGENRNRFIKATDHLIFPASRSGHLRQMQLI